MSVVVRPARADDFERFLGHLLPYRTKAYVGEKDGEVIGLGGVMFLPNGVGLAYADLTDKAAPFPVALHKAALRVMTEARAAGWRLVATCDPEWPTGQRWLERLGFEATGDFADGRKVYVWSSPA